MYFVNHILLKTEPSSYSIDDLKRDGATSWTGVRNYQARNIIRDEIKLGDLCIMYHSSCAVPAAVGVGKVVKTAYADPLQFDVKSEYYDARSPKATLRWLAFDVAFVEKFKTPVTLAQMRTVSSLADMCLLGKGNRLSVFPVAKKHFETIVRLSK